MLGAPRGPASREARICRKFAYPLVNLNKQLVALHCGGSLRSVARCHRPSSINRMLVMDVTRAIRAASHQQEADLVQAQIRADLAAGRRSLFKPAAPRPGPSTDVLEGRIAEELDLIVRQLGQVGDILSDDPILLHRHAAQLQSIDLMQQKLRHLGSIVASDDKAMAVDRVTLVNLKTRLTRTSLLP
jgi:hypothetical protein